MSGRVWRWINIAPLNGGHEEEVARDLKQLAMDTVVDAAAFCCSLHPEGDPVFDKAAVLSGRFLRMKAMLKDSGIACGILIQSSMGHGWVPDAPSPFPRIENRDGSRPYTMCPLGRDFQDYIRRQVAALAACRPDFIMLDDDTRLITGHDGCFCPLHLEEMRRLTGREFTRESLVAAMEDDPGLAETFDTLLKDSIVKLAGIIREEMDRVDPAMAGSFCSCAGDIRHAGDISAVMAGKGGRRTIRLNNGRYTVEGLRDIPRWLSFTARQLASLPGDALILDEPDTCPHNRYSTSAASLNHHIIMGLQEGCGGIKLWITRLAEYEPASGTAYREVMKRNSGLYREIIRLAPEWDGVRIKVSAPPAEPKFPAFYRNWADCALGFMGIPVSFGREPGRISALGGEEAAGMTDGELRELLSGNLLLDGGAALALARRGCSHLIGVRAAEWNLPTPAFETAENWRFERSCRAVDLRDTLPGAVRLSTLFGRAAALSEEATELAPGSLEFVNSEGGRIITMAAILPVDFSLPSYYFYSEARRRQLITLLNRFGEKLCWYTGDAPLLLKTGRSAQGDRLVLADNLGYDRLETLTLAMPEIPGGIRRLSGGGEWEDVPFTVEAGTVIVRTVLETMAPVILRIL